MNKEKLQNNIIEWFLEYIWMCYQDQGLAGDENIQINERWHNQTTYRDSVISSTAKVFSHPVYTLRL